MLQEQGWGWEGLYLRTKAPEGVSDCPQMVNHTQSSPKLLKDLGGAHGKVTPTSSND